MCMKEAAILLLVLVGHHLTNQLSVHPCHLPVQCTIHDQQVMVCQDSFPSPVSRLQPGSLPVRSVAGVRQHRVGAAMIPLVPSFHKTSIRQTDTLGTFSAGGTDFCSSDASAALLVFLGDPSVVPNAQGMEPREWPRTYCIRSCLL